MKRLVQLVLLLALLAWCVPAHAVGYTITRVGNCAAATTSCTLPAHKIGDLIFGFAFRAGSNTAPTLPAGWTSIDSAGANTSSYIKGCKTATTNAETSGTWTNATELIVVIYRGQRFGLTAQCLSAVVGGVATEANGSSTSMTYNSITLTVADGSSWILHCGGHESATDVEQPPTGLTNIVAVGTEIACHDSNAGVSSFTGSSVTVNASDGWHTKGVEIRAGDPFPVTHLCGTDTTVNSDNVSCTIVGTTTTGNTIILQASNGNNTFTITSVSDGTNTYVATPLSPCSGVTYTRRNWTYYVANATSVTNPTYTVTFSSSGTQSRQLRVFEAWGLSTSTPFDKDTCAEGASTVPDPGSTALSFNNELIMEFARVATLPTVGATFTVTTTLNIHLGQLKNVTAGSWGASAFATSISSWLAMGTTFTDAVGGGAVVPYLPMRGVGYREELAEEIEAESPR